MTYGSNQYGSSLYGGAIGGVNSNGIGWDLTNFPINQWPMPPFNGEVLSPMFRGTLDLRWDDPAILAANTPWCVVGVNIYRSDVGERGPYVRINDYPLGGTFYRDFTENVQITQESVLWDSSWLQRGNGPNTAMWRFQTQFPIVNPSYPDRCVFATRPGSVTVTVDGQYANIHEVFGQSGEVTLNNTRSFDPATQTSIAPVLPDAASQVFVSYTTNRNSVGYELDRKVFYRITTVAEHPDAAGGLVETPLDYCQPLTVYKVESLDWIWREAVRRNNWILEQGGERVKVFIRKTAGIPCDCGWDARKRAYMKQYRSSCLSCYGTGFIGGYEGPYETIVAPPDIERNVQQTMYGRTVEEQYDVWTGPTPMLTQRDFIVKQTNERYSVGPVRKPTNRGNILQQHFNMRRLDETDIRYEIPIDGLADLPWPNSRVTIDPREECLVYPLAEYGPMHQLTPSEHSPQVYPASPDYQATPTGTEKDNIGDSREHRGRSQTWENHNY